MQKLGRRAAPKPSWLARCHTAVMVISVHISALKSVVQYAICHCLESVEYCYYRYVMSSGLLT